MVFDAGTLALVFDRLDNLLSKFEGSSTPQVEHVGSVRRSSTAGPSDNARLNPLTQVADSAPRVLMRPLDLQRLCVSLLPRVLAILLPKNLANYLLLMLERIVGSRFALDVWEIRPQRVCAPGWIRSIPRSPSIERPSTLSCPVRCLPLLTIIVICMFSTPSMITFAVLLLSHVRLPHPVAVGILQMSLLQLRLPPPKPRSFVTPRVSSFTSAWAFFSQGSAIRFTGPSSSTRRFKRSFPSPWHLRRSLT